MFFMACHTHTANCAQNILLLLSPYSPPSPIQAQAQFRWGLSPPESRSWGSRGHGNQWGKIEAFSVLENMLPRSSCSPEDKKRVK